VKFSIIHLCWALGFESHRVAAPDLQHGKEEFHMNNTISSTELGNARLSSQVIFL
jgi:hypothetical protein